MSASIVLIYAFVSFCDFFSFEMADVKGHRVCIKFCFKLGKNATKTHKMLKQVFGEDALGQTQTYDWFNRFKNGRTSVDGERSGRPSTGKTPENVAKKCVRLSTRIVDDP
jgi:hypothetical protein